MTVEEKLELAIYTLEEIRMFAKDGIIPQEADIVECVNDVLKIIGE